MPGVVWAGLAGVAFGFSQLANRGLNRRFEALPATTAMVTAMLGALILATTASGQVGGLSEIPLVAVGWFVAAAVVHFLFGWTLFAISQQRIGPSRTASVLSVNPVGAAILASLFISQALRPITWLGVIAVTVGVAVVAGGVGARRADGLAGVLPILERR